MKVHLEHLNLLLKKLLLAFVIFTLTRILFYVFNTHHFTDVSVSLFFYGIRFDAVAIAYLFLPLIVFQLIPLPFKHKRWYRLMLSFFFYLGNSIGIILNLIDLAYFDFTFKRTTSDFFNMISTGDDFLTLLPHYVIDFWYDYILLAILIYFSYWGHKKIIASGVKKYGSELKDYLRQFLIFFTFFGVTVIAMRGGIQLKPISIVNAGQYATAKNTPIVLNTPFTVIKTLFKKKLSRIHYFDEKELPSHYSPKTVISGNGSFKGRNVVIVILESFAKEYVGGFNNGRGYTPFIDSLLQSSYMFNKSLCKRPKFYSSTSTNIRRSTTINEYQFCHFPLCNIKFRCFAFNFKKARI